MRTGWSRWGASLKRAVYNNHEEQEILPADKYVTL